MSHSPSATTTTPALTEEELDAVTVSSLHAPLTQNTNVHVRLLSLVHTDSNCVQMNPVKTVQTSQMILHRTASIGICPFLFIKSQIKGKQVMKVAELEISIALTQD